MGDHAPKLHGGKAKETKRGKARGKKTAPSAVQENPPEPIPDEAGLPPQQPTLGNPS